MHKRNNIAYIIECRNTFKSVDIKTDFHFYFISLPAINNIVRYNNTARLYSYMIVSTFILHTLIILKYKEKLTGGCNEQRTINVRKSHTVSEVNNALKRNLKRFIVILKRRIRS